MSQESKDIFLNKFGNIKPLKSKNRIKREIPKTTIAIKKTTKQKATTAIKKNQTTKENKEEKKPKNYSFEASKTKKLLKKGKIKIDKKIDFHGKTLFDAENEFIDSVKNSYYQQKRCLLFITGKGLATNKKPDNHTHENKETKLYYGKIREAFLNWINKPSLSKFILSYERADIQNGGDGAFFVYLRKIKN